MKIRLMVLGVLLSSTAAFAQPSAFGKVTKYQASQQSFMFACGMRDARGKTYGTAQEMTINTDYTFRTDGSYTTWMHGMTDGGVYKMVGNKVTLTPIFDGKRGSPYVLVLSADGSTLGTMKRI